MSAGCRALLLIGQSARLLAASARRGGYQPWVVDCYLDWDTQALASRARRVAALEPVALAAALAELTADQSRALPLVYGSGVEHDSALFAVCARYGRVLGNQVPVLAQFVEPRRFFALLDQLSIAYPDTQFRPPARLTNWLLKSRCGAGGKGVRCAGFAPHTVADYWQRWIHGIPVSLLFLADGKGVAPIGFNTQFLAPQPEAPFLYGGSMNRADLPATQRAQMVEAAARVTSASGLQGLNSFDFVYDGQRVWALELNPRPSASVALYDPDYPGGLLQAHLGACHGVGLPTWPGSATVRAQQILYAMADCVAPAPSAWPPGSTDLPRSGQLLRRGQPVITVAAAGTTTAATLALLAQRLQQAQALLAPLDAPLARNQSNQPCAAGAP